MKIKTALFLTAFGIILTTAIINISGCDSSTQTQLGEPVSFNRDIQPILAQKLQFPPGATIPPIKQAGLDLTSWEGMMINGSSFGAEVIPYNAQWSHLVQHINRIDTNISPFSEPLMPQAKNAVHSGLAASGKPVT